MEMNNDIGRPEEITCDALWELYKMFEGPEHRYLWYGGYEKSEADEKIMCLESATLHDGGLELEPLDLTDIELAVYKMEWIDLVLRYLDNGEEKKYTCSIIVNALKENNIRKEDLLARNKLRIALETEPDGEGSEEDKSR